MVKRVMYMQFEGRKNNKGFTLLEILVAVIILAVISVPLVRTFSTSIRTNAKARILMKSTTAAENLLEEFRYAKVDDLVDKYNKGNNTVTEETVSGKKYKKIKFQIKDQDNFREQLPDSYMVELELDPNEYPNANSLNAGEFGGVSIEDSAIFTMDTTFDEDVYDVFVTRNDELANNSYLYSKIPDPYRYFRNNLKRKITVDIQKVGTLKDSSGEDIDAVQAMLKIEYTAPSTKYDGLNVLTEADLTYTKTDVLFFDNAVTKKPLNGVYLFFNPRCAAACMDNTRDVVVINNNNNIDCNVYLVAQMTFANDEDAQKLLLYKSNRGLNVTVNEKADGGSADDAHITLRTNLSSAAPYSTDVVDMAKSNLTLTYNRGAIVKSNDNAQKALHCGAVDGKALNPSDANKRIYAVKVRVLDATDPSAPYEVVELDGTKLE